MKTLSKKMLKVPVTALAAVLGLGLMANEANATIVLATSNINPQGANAPLNLDLDGLTPGVQVVKPFIVNAPGLARVIFNAEASIAGGPNTWLDETIFIDGVPCTPTQTNDNAFVSGAGAAATANDAWISAASQCYARLNAGVHTVRVFMSPVNPGNSLWRLDDMSLVIDTQ